MEQSPSLNLKVYLIPGLAADGRSFDYLLDHLPFEGECLPLLVPERGERLPGYARRMAAVIPPGPVLLIGSSLGGMIAQEIAHFRQDTELILISSAQGRREIPLRYRMLRHLPVHRLVGGRTYQVMTGLIGPLVEREIRPFKALARQMLRDKPAAFFPRAIDMIAHWEQEVPPPVRMHIHGENDLTLPIRHVSPSHILAGGSHFSVITRAEEIAALIKAELEPLKAEPVPAL